MSHNQPNPNRGKGILVALGGLLSALGTAVAVIFTLGRGLRRREGGTEPERTETGRTATSAPAPSPAARPGTETRPPASEPVRPADAPALGFPLHPGWHRVDEPLPAPTYWPVVMALGITLIAWGVVTTPLISGAGLVLLALALVGWIGDLRHEQRHDP